MRSHTKINQPRAVAQRRYQGRFQRGWLVLAPSSPPASSGLLGKEQNVPSADEEKKNVGKEEKEENILQRGKNPQLKGTRGESLSQHVQQRITHGIGGAGRDLWRSPSPAKGSR